MSERNVIYDVRNLKTTFPLKSGVLKKVIGEVKAVDDVTFQVYEGETLGVVGESGCGKSTLGKSMMLLETPESGTVEMVLDDEPVDITKIGRGRMLEFRKRVQMVFQDPYSAFNPMKRIYTSFEEPLKVHGYRSRADRDAQIIKALEMVNIQPDYLMRYPHEFSGGQRQRLCIARALVVGPKVLICDEPVSALDVSIQAQILNLMKEIQRDLGLTYLFIAHDLSVVQYMSDRIMVMYLGKVVEIASSKELYDHPVHPYTQVLLSAIPVPVRNLEKKRIVPEGEVPSPINKPAGCAFHTRCPFATDLCRNEVPELKDVSEGHQVACHYRDKGVRLQ